MPSSIPYDPSLVLANIVSQERLADVLKISEWQAPVDAAQEKLNALLALKRSLDMTRMELETLGIGANELAKEIVGVNTQVEKAAIDYAKAKLNAEKLIQPLRAKVRSVHAEVESPVDYLKTEIKSMQLSADSISMDVQYFSREGNRENSKSFASTIGTFVSAQTAWLGIKTSSEITNNAQNQVSSQVKEHDISGTLVLSVSCTHKNSSLLAPLVINPDKGIKAWNKLFPKDPINPNNRSEMHSLATQAATSSKKESKYSIISGMTYGSSFVGMVHVLNTSRTETSQSLSSLATSLQATMDAGLWFEDTSGGFGVNASFADEVKNLLSTQNITSHVTLICQGAIPSMVANDVKMGVDRFASFDPKTSMEAIATIQNATVADQGTVQQSAEAARTGGKMIALKTGEVKAALTALGEIEERANKILDINSMMSALDDYLKKAAEGTAGVPINYFLKDITKTALAELWVAKYYPQTVQIREDDSERTDPNK